MKFNLKAAGLPPVIALLLLGKAGATEEILKQATRVETHGPNPPVSHA
jgi:hypothetical protein